MRLEGLTYQQIANTVGVSRQRIQQLLSPPKEIRDYVIRKFNGKCVDCGIQVGKSGHVHHNNGDEENYNDIENLELLCISCHKRRHKGDNTLLKRVRDYAQVMADEAATQAIAVEALSKFCQCLRCNHKWFSRSVNLPARCPKCQSKHWNELGRKERRE